MLSLYPLNCINLPNNYKMLNYQTLVSAMEVLLVTVPALSTVAFSEVL
jgi:hypothetical protein